MGDETRDDLFAKTAPAAGDFRFDAAMARVLPDMLQRSIPGYQSLLELIGALARERVPSAGRVYDLGSSLGAVSLSVRHALGQRPARIVAVDSSAPMIERCRELLTHAGLTGDEVELHVADVRDFPVASASLIVLNFTLQFVPIPERDALVRRLASALLPGGCLVLSEKTEPAEPDQAQLFSSLHDGFRELNGYSGLEMARKRQALENVLWPEAPADHEARLAAAGLRPQIWFRSLQFVSWLAEKPS